MPRSVQIVIPDQMYDAYYGFAEEEGKVITTLIIESLVDVRDMRTCLGHRYHQVVAAHCAGGSPNGVAPPTTNHEHGPRGGKEDRAE